MRGKSLVIMSKEHLTIYTVIPAHRYSDASHKHPHRLVHSHDDAADLLQTKYNLAFNLIRSVRFPLLPLSGLTGYRQF